MLRILLLILILGYLLVKVLMRLGIKKTKKIGNNMTIIPVIILQDRLVFDNLLSFSFVVEVISFIQIPGRDRYSPLL